MTTCFRRFGVLALLASLCGVATAHAQPTAPAPSEPFYQAIRDNDLTGLRSLIASGGDVNAHDRRGGATPLMHAAAIGSKEAMTLLLDAGADANARSAARATALMWSVADEGKVRLLLDRGAEVNAASESGRTALHLAAMSDHSAAIVRLLLQRGANPKAVDAINLTTLLAATFGNDSDTIRQLLDAGVDVNQAEQGETPETAGTTPLMTAASEGNTDSVRLLLAKGADVNAVSGQALVRQKNGIILLGKFTALILAAGQSSPDLVRTLLDAGADVNAREARGMTALMYAASSDHSDPEVVRLLLARGADTTIKTPEGESALDWARKSGPTPIAALLAAVANPAPPMTPVASHGSAAPAPTRQAVERSVVLLDRMAATFFTNAACGSCHAQNATDVALAAARRHGVAVNDTAVMQRRAGAAAQFSGTATRLLERFDPPVVDILLYAAAGLAAAGHPADRGAAVGWGLLVWPRRHSSTD